MCYPLVIASFRMNAKQPSKRQKTTSFVLIMFSFNQVVCTINFFAVSYEAMEGTEIEGLIGTPSTPRWLIDPAPPSLPSIDSEEQSSPRLGNVMVPDIGHLVSAGHVMATPLGAGNAAVGGPALVTPSPLPVKSGSLPQVPLATEYPYGHGSRVSPAVSTAEYPYGSGSRNPGGDSLDYFRRSPTMYDAREAEEKHWQMLFATAREYGGIQWANLIQEIERIRPTGEMVTFMIAFSNPLGPAVSQLVHLQWQNQGPGGLTGKLFHQPPSTQDEFFQVIPMVFPLPFHLQLLLSDSVRMILSDSAITEINDSPYGGGSSNFIRRRCGAASRNLMDEHYAQTPCVCECCGL